MAKMGQHLILVFALAGAVFGVRPGDFKVLGPGGGGAMFNPTISPHDPNTVLVACDMTGAYITHDGGRNWRMFNLRDVVHFFVFDPVYPKPMTIEGIRMNSDHSDETIIAKPDPLGAIYALAIDPDDIRTLYVAAV